MKLIDFLYESFIPRTNYIINLEIKEKEKFIQFLKKSMFERNYF